MTSKESNKSEEPKKSKTFWPSAIPLVENCPASAAHVEGEIRINATGTPAKVGRAAHAMAEKIIRDDLRQAPDPFPFALEHGVEGEAEDLKFLSIFAVQAWQGTKGAPGLKGAFPEAQVETRLSHTMQETNPATGEIEEVRISGMIDVLSIHPDPHGGDDEMVAVIADWKSGRKHEENDYIGQMKAYALLAAAQDKRIAKVRTVLVWLRDREGTVLTFTRDELRSWAQNFLKRSAFWDGETYRPGEHCGYCPRFAECPGRERMLRNALAVFSGRTFGEEELLVDPQGNLVPADIIHQAFTNANALAKAIHQFKDQLKVEILRRGGALAIPSLPGRVLGIKKKRGRTAINAQKAWPVVTRELTVDELAPCVQITKTKLMEAIRKTAPRGQKTKKADAILEELKQAGALSESRPQEILQVIKLPNAIEPAKRPARTDAEFLADATEQVEEARAFVEAGPAQKQLPNKLEGAK